MPEAPQVVEYLNLIVTSRAQLAQHHTTPGVISQEAFVLAHGRAFEWRPLPAAVEPGVPRACFRNAAMVTLVSPRQYTYCEGYALGFIPVHHAWVIDRDGFVIDPTWDETCRGPHPEYFGVPFRTAYVKRIALRKRNREGFTLLDNYWDGWPLCTGKHKVTEAVCLKMRNSPTTMSSGTNRE